MMSFSNSGQFQRSETGIHLAAHLIRTKTLCYCQILVYAFQDALAYEVVRLLYGIYHNNLAIY